MPLPRSILRALGIRVGDTLTMSANAERILLEKK